MPRGWRGWIGNSLCWWAAASASRHCRASNTKAEQDEVARQRKADADATRASEVETAAARSRKGKGKRASLR